MLYDFREEMVERLTRMKDVDGLPKYAFMLLNYKY
jgi:hypothetical protein